MLVASFAVLIRTENVVLLVLAVLFLFLRFIQNWYVQRKINAGNGLFRQLSAFIMQIGFASLLAVLPLLAWATHNYQQHGFWGLSNYAGEVFYTGWIYEGEVSHIPITDQSSPAVKLINEAYWSDPNIAQAEHVPTGWMIHPYLVKHGLTNEEAFSVLGQAALDSIKKDYRITWRVIVVKIRDSFKPEPGGMETFPLPGEDTDVSSIKAGYFEEENFIVQPLVLVQRKAYEFLARYYVRVYPIWAWFCVGAMLLCLYRKPVIPWLPIVLITLFRVGFPNIFGLSLWRFVIPGLPLMQILALAGLQSLCFFAVSIFRAFKNRTQTLPQHQRIS
jgi:hypothetical protein